MKYQEIFPAEVVEVQGKPFLFTHARVDRETIPDKLHAYDVADACDGSFWKIAEFVLVNHWGTIIGTDEVMLDEHGQYDCPPDPMFPELSSEGLFTGDVIDSAENLVTALEEIRQEM